MTWLLACDVCGNQTRLPNLHRDVNRFLYEWKLMHHGHVYLDGTSAFDHPPMTDPFNAHPLPCHGETLVGAAS